MRLEELAKVHWRNSFWEALGEEPTERQWRIVRAVEMRSMKKVLEMLSGNLDMEILNAGHEAYELGFNDYGLTDEDLAKAFTAMVHKTMEKSDGNGTTADTD